MNTEQLREAVRQLKPWHQNIQLTDRVDVRSAFNEQEQQRANNDNVSLVNLRATFFEKTQKFYPDGLFGKRFLDCACNAGGYCFWAREMGADQVFGFDVREHWIKQARFVAEHRDIAPTDRIRFEICDLMQLPTMQLEPVEFALFKGIFYHLANPISGLKLVADLTTEVLWFNSAIRHAEQDALFCNFESVDAVMSGVHALSWIPSGPRVITKLLYWLGFTDVWHVFTRKSDRSDVHGRMELIASKVPGLLDGLGTIQGAFKFDIEKFKNAKVADEAMRSAM